jgi:hypothetical protein
MSEEQQQQENTQETTPEEPPKSAHWDRKTAEEAHHQAILKPYSNMALPQPGEVIPRNPTTSLPMQEDHAKT